MTASSLHPPTKGMRMIAAYRAERLGQRPVLRNTLQQTRVALRSARCGGHVGAESDQPAVEAQLQAEGGPPDGSQQGSIFANLVKSVVQEQPAPVPPDNNIVSVTEEKPSEPQTADAADDHEPAAGPAADPPAPVYDPPLAEIGFGPGMLIRLSQLGLHTTRDLARADAGQLRAALGEISRLVDVDAWINSARHSSNAGSP